MHDPREGGNVDQFREGRLVPAEVRHLARARIEAEALLSRRVSIPIGHDAIFASRSSAFR